MAGPALPDTHMQTQAAPSVPTPRDYSQGPVPYFDLHLRILSETYISFFQDRVKIEEAYIDSLLKLHAKTAAIDGHFDDRTELNSARRAWREIRDNLDREAQSRVALITTIKTDVLAPLSSLKETQERTRKRIKEDLKDSISAHTDYAETCDRYKRVYLKRCQDVEDHRTTPSTPLTAPPPSSFSPPPSAASSNGSHAPIRQTMTAPTPSHLPPRQPTQGGAGPRTRSPSTSTALSDLAHHGKKGLNQLITFLDGGKPSGTNKDGFVGRSEGALRNVRAKREADDADKEYRKGIHWLETLRIRRVKILEAGYNSLEQFLKELSETLKSVLNRYVDNLTATYSSNTQFISHAGDYVDRVNPTNDIAYLHSLIPRSLALGTPKQVLYYNYTIGECNDLIFGVGLVDYANARSLPDGEIPRLVRLCIKEVETRGLESEGIYRISGRHANVQDITHRIERNEREFAFNPVTDDVYCVSGILKLYLRELPEPLFKFPLQERIQHTEARDEHAANDFRVLRAKMRRLPPVHQATLKAVIEHLGRVASLAANNKMDTRNLAIVFGSVIFGEDEMPKGADILSMQTWKDTVLEDLIHFSHTLFDDRAVTASPPLPPAPEGESGTIYEYGSSFTKVKTLPPKNLPAEKTEDFTPQLPPRPGNSIHPSRRAQPQVPNAEVPPSPTTQHTPEMQGPDPQSKENAPLADNQVISSPVSPDVATFRTAVSGPPSPTDEYEMITPATGSSNDLPSDSHKKSLDFVAGSQ